MLVLTPTPHRRKTIAPALFGLALALCTSLAVAADPPPAKAKTTPKPAPKTEGAFGKGSSTLPVLSMDELRQCLSEQDRIKKEGADLAQAQAGMDKERADIESMGTELAADKAKIDASDEAAVNAYNERVRKRTQMIEAFKASAPVFNARVDKLVVDRKAYAEACADRRFFEEDYDAIKAGK